MANIDKIKIGSTTYNISPSWNNITGKPSTYPPDSHNHDDRYLKINDTAANSNKNKGKHIYVQQSQPTGQYVGDLWITW